MKSLINKVNRFCRVLPAAILMAASGIMCGCEADSDLDLDLAVDSNKIVVKAAGGSTRVMVYSTGVWNARLSENIEWGSIDKFKGEGISDVLFSYSKNYGAVRKAELVLSYDGKVDTVTIVQEGTIPEIAIRQSRVAIESGAAEVSVPFYTNIPQNIGDMEVTISYLDEEGKVVNPDDYMGEMWIESATLTEEALLVQVTANTTGEERQGRIRVAYKAGNDVTYSSTTTIVQGDKQNDYITFAEIRAMVAGTEGEADITANKVLKAVVISDAGNVNMETNPNTTPIAINFDESLKTAYIQSEDGTMGFRIKTATTDDNVMRRYSSVLINVRGLKVVKESDPERYTLTGFTSANIEEEVAGTKSNLATKQKYINELTDEDIYTFVSLKDVEITLSDGSYFNGSEGYALKDETFNPMGTGAPRYDCYPLNLTDKRSGHIYMLMNSKVEWRRIKGAGVPKGSGILSGIVVNTKLQRYGTEDGNIGRYSIRPVEQSDIALSKDASSRFSTTLVEWNWNDAKLTKDAQNRMSPNIGSGLLYHSAYLTPASTNDFNNTDNTTATKGLVSNGGIAIASKWWNFNENKGEALIAEFSTAGIESVNLNFCFSMGSGSGSTATCTAPAYWHIEYSTDGENYTELPDSRFSIHPLVWWSNTMPLFCTPGNCDFSFTLPNTLFGQEKVYVKIIADSTICATATAPYGGTITSSNANVSVRFGAVSVRHN